MAKKPKFRPEVTRIPLNPEQGVLACNCFEGVQKNLAQGGYQKAAAGIGSACDWGAKTAGTLVSACGKTGRTSGWTSGGNGAAGS